MGTVPANNCLAIIVVGGGLGSVPGAVIASLPLGVSVSSVTLWRKISQSFGEVVKEVQVQIVKDGRFHHFGVVADMDLITP